jgi:hypothetical protein
MTIHAGINLECRDARATVVDGALKRLPSAVPSLDQAGMNLEEKRTVKVHTLVRSSQR